VEEISRLDEADKLATLTDSKRAETECRRAKLARWSQSAAQRCVFALQLAQGVREGRHQHGHHLVEVGQTTLTRATKQRAE
jgi:hypothetical protein